MELPSNKLCAEMLAEWYKINMQLRALKASESLLRWAIFRGAFEEPKEGSNRLPLNDGTGAVLTATHVINRTITQVDYDQMASAISEIGKNDPGKGERLTRLGVELFKFEPKLSISAYRTLTEEERKFFDSHMVVKEGSPQMKIEIPKAKKGKGDAD